MKFKNRFYVTVKVKSFFTFKDKLHYMFLSELVYKYQYGGCDATYYGESKHYFKLRICEHLGEGEKR